MNKSRQIYIAFFIIICVADIQAGLKDDLRNARDKIHTTVDDTMRKAKDKTEEYKNTVDDTMRKAKDKTEEYKNTAEDTYRNKLNDVQNKYGWNAANKIQEIKAQYGSSLSEKATEAYQQFKPAVASAFVDIYKLKGEAAGDNLKRTLGQLRESSQYKLIDAYKEHQPIVASKINDAYHKYGDDIGDKVKASMDQCAYKISNYAKDKDNQEKIINAAVGCVVLHSKFQDQKKQVTYALMTRAMDNIIVKDKDGRSVSLNDYSKKWINENAPFLEGTDIAEDPAKAITYGIIYRDAGYITQDMKIVRSQGEYVSINQAVIQEIGMENTIKYIEVAGAFKTIGDPDASTADYDNAAATIYNFSNNQ